MYIVIIPDGAFGKYGREPRIEFHKTITPDEEKYYEKQKNERGYVVEQFSSIEMLRYIILKCEWTKGHILYKIEEGKKPTDIIYLECIDTLYIIEKDKVSHTRLFESWGNALDIRTNEKGELELV